MISSLFSQSFIRFIDQSGNSGKFSFKTTDLNYFRHLKTKVQEFLIRFRKTAEKLPIKYLLVKK